MRADELTGGREVPLADVEQHQHWLLGQEPEATHRLRLVLGQAGVADRPAGLELRLEPAQDDLLALVRLALGRRPVAAAGAEPLEPTVDHREVGEDELEVQLLEVARRVHASPTGCGSDGSSNARTTWSSASDSRSRARCSAGSSSVPTWPSRRSRRRGQVDVGHVGVDDLLRLEDLGQPVEARVRHLDHADVERQRAEPAGLGVTARQGVEDGGLAAAGEADDRDLHLARRAANAAMGSHQPDHQ